MLQVYFGQGHTNVHWLHLLLQCSSAAARGATAAPAMATLLTATALIT
jgi:hypothetical protein